MYSVIFAINDILDQELSEYHPMVRELSYSIIVIAIIIIIIIIITIIIIIYLYLAVCFTVKNVEG